MVIACAESFVCDSTKSKEEWNERLYSDVAKIRFEGLATRTFDFDYKILDPENDGGYFYFFLRLASGEWAGHDKGKMVVDNIVITKA